MCKKYFRKKMIESKPHMTKLYGYDRNDDGIMINKRIYWEHPKQDSNSNVFLFVFSVSN